MSTSTRTLTTKALPMRLSIVGSPSEQLSQSTQHAVQSAAYHLYSIWLFTFSDLKTIVFPTTIFGIINAVALARFGVLETPLNLARTAPLALFYVWINLLPFSIDNQRQSDAIAEDMLNKPWRPMPSKRLKPSQATRLMFGAYIAAFVISTSLGAWRQHLALVFFGWCYNDLKGADRGFIVRNLINGFGYTCFTTGALQIAVNGEEQPLRYLGWWLVILFLVICTTVQSQDMGDQEGDALRGRKTMPLEVGDGAARWSIAVAVMSWTALCPWVWQSHPAARIAVGILGLAVSYRTLAKRSVAADRRTFHIWNVWLTMLFCQPLMTAVPGVAT